MVENKYSNAIIIFLLGIFLYTSCNSNGEHIKKDYLELDHVWIELDTFASDSSCLRQCWCKYNFNLKSDVYYNIELEMYEDTSEYYGPIISQAFYEKDFLLGGAFPYNLGTNTYYVSANKFTTNMNILNRLFMSCRQENR